MDVKRIRFLTTLKVGKVYRKGKTLDAPFPSSIREELRAIASGSVNPPTIEVLERVGESPAIPSQEEAPAEIASTELAQEQTIVDDVEKESAHVDEEDLKLQAIADAQPKGPGEGGPPLTGEYAETEVADEKPKKPAAKPKTEKPKPKKSLPIRKKK